MEYPSMEHRNIHECNRKEHPNDLVVSVGPAKIGGEHFAVIAGPCAIESEEQIVTVAREVKKAGAQILRAGAFKPRTSPYDFQGLGKEGLQFLSLAKQETGLPTVSEITSLEELPLFSDVDMLQVGARSMQNYELLKELGHTRKPILLKRGMANTLTELLMSAEYIMSGGNQQVVLCERGIRTFNDITRNTLDLSAVPVLHELSQLPVIVDPSHGTGLYRLVPPMSLAATACGANGLIIEVHSDPVHALSDGDQSLSTAHFADLCQQVMKVRKALQG